MRRDEPSLRKVVILLVLQVAIEARVAQGLPSRLDRSSETLPKMTLMTLVNKTLEAYAVWTHLAYSTCLLHTIPTHP